MPDIPAPQKDADAFLPERDLLASAYFKALLLIAPGADREVERIAADLASARRFESRSETSEAQIRLVACTLMLIEVLGADDETTLSASASLVSLRTAKFGFLLDGMAQRPAFDLPEEDRDILRSYRSDQPRPGKTPEAGIIIGRNAKGLAQPSERLQPDFSAPSQDNIAYAPAAARHLAGIFWQILAIRNWATAAHSLRVADLCVAVADQLDMSASNRENLLIAGLLHDVGKLGIAPAILEKGGHLDHEERAEMRSHAHLGRDLITGFEGFEIAAHLVGNHHEKCDGSGYPYGLQGTDLDPLTRLLTVVDVYDALAFERPYRAALQTADVFSIMTDEMRTALDQEIVERLRNVLAGETLTS